MQCFSICVIAHLNIVQLHKLTPTDQQETRLDGRAGKYPKVVAWDRKC